MNDVSNSPETLRQQVLQSILSLSPSDSAPDCTQLILLMKSNQTAQIHRCFDILSASAAYLALSSHQLQDIISIALTFDFIKHHQSNPPLTQAYFNFSQNLALCNAQYVEPVVRTITKSFLSISIHSHIGTHAVSLLHAILTTYPTAVNVFSTAFAAFYPHIRREKSMCLNYSAFLLEFSKVSSNLHIIQCVVSLITSKIAAMDAEINHVKSYRSEQQQQLGVFDIELQIDDESMDTKLDELLALCYAFLERLYFSEQPSDLLVYYNCLYRAFETHIVSMVRPHYSLYVLYFAASLDSQLILDLSERLRSAFNDRSSPSFIRSNCAIFSTSIITQSRFLSSHQIMNWITSMISWLHLYLDSTRDPSIDSDVHALFYTAFQCIMLVITTKTSDLFHNELAIDTIRSLRMASLIRSPLNPLRMVSSNDLVSRFSEVLNRYEILDCFDVLARNAYVTIASQTSRGSKNQVAFHYPFSCYFLPQSQHFIHKYFNVLLRTGGANGGDEHNVEEETHEFSEHELPESGVVVAGDNRERAYEDKVTLCATSWDEPCPVD